MSVKIGANVISQMVQRNLADSTNRLASASERISSGQRINKASDDAAGLSIAESLNADSRIYSQGIRNANDGISYLTIADSALNQLSQIVQRKIELAEQCANGVYANEQRLAADREMTALTDEYNRIIATTEFNGLKMLDYQNSSGPVRIQVGYGLEGSIEFKLGEQLATLSNTGVFVSTNPVTGESTFSSAATAGDVNNDGIADLVSAGAGASGEVTVRLGDGQGGFGAGTTYASEGALSKDVSLTDVNSDGYLDLISVGQGGAGGEISIRINNQNGTFGARQAIAFSDTSANSVALGDINNDGKVELVVGGEATATGGKVSVYSNNGSGVFTLSNSYNVSQTSVNSIKLADINGDGSLDILAGGVGSMSPGGVVSVLSNSGSGAYSLSSTMAMESATTNAVETADVNMDGLLDIITTGQTSGDTGQANVRLNIGGGQFGAATSYTQEGFSSGDLSVQDINGDEIVDLVTSGLETIFPGPGTTTVRFGQSDGTFGTAMSYETSVYQTRSVTLADLNNDGVKELIAAGDDAGAGAGGVVSVMSSEPELTTNLINYSIGTQRLAATTLDRMRNQLQTISAERGAIGAVVSRITVAMNNLTALVENSKAAESRVRDVDIASESANVTREQIVQQAAAAVLAQANQAPTLALSLLKG